MTSRTLGPPRARLANARLRLPPPKSLMRESMLPNCTPPAVPRRFSAAIVFAAVSTLSACGGGDGGSTAPQPGGGGVREVVVTPDSLRLPLGQTGTLRAEARTATGTVSAAAIDWSSETPAVATVSAAGIVTAVTPGRVRIVARSGTVTGGAWVTVIRPDTASVTVRAGDSTRVIVGNGSGVVVAPGGLPNGARVAAEERVNAAGLPTVRLTITAAPSGGAPSTTPVTPARVFVMTNTAVATSPLPRVRATAVLANDRRVLTSPVVLSATPTVDQAGRSVTRLETSLMLSAATAQAGRTVIDLEYLADPTPESAGYALYAAGTRGATTRFSGSRIPVVLVHGIQPGRQTADHFAAWYPDETGEMWEPLIGSITADSELRSAVEPWIFRYPTYNGVAFNARRLRELLAERFGSQSVLVIAHSSGGLVSTVAMLDEPQSQQIARLITLGTPFLGTPLARDDATIDLIASELASGNCTGADIPVATASGALTELLADRSEGYRDLSDRSAIVDRVRQGLRSLDARVRAVGAVPAVGSSASISAVLALPTCAMRVLGAGDHDGVVAISSATPNLVTSTVRISADHLGLTGSSAARTEVLQSLRASVRAQPRLVFATEPPARTPALSPMSTIRVAVRDGSGQTITSATNTITLSLASNTTGAVLGGTLTRAAVQGVATFDGVTIDRIGSYTIVAQSPSLPSASSVAITVEAPRAITSLVLSPASLTVATGANGSVTATVTQPQGAAPATLTYASLNTAVATVTGSGNTASIRGVSIGSATIRVTATAPGNAAFPTATVTEDVTVNVSLGGSTALGSGFGIEQFALIPTGTFTMGTPTGGFADERPARQVTISRAFRMQRTEVTQAQWRAIMGSNPSTFQECGDTCPIETVSLNDIRTFLQRLNAADPGKNYRLPTEAEWEYAARAGTTGDYGVSGNVCTFAWVSDCGAEATRRVAQGTANAWGLYDMHGNVWEWVNDWYAIYPSTPQTDPTGPATGVNGILRGGSWFGDAITARAAFRGTNTLTARLEFDGFRLVRNP